MSRIRSVALLTGAASSLVLGCKFVPETPKLVYTLNAKSVAENESFADDPAAQAQLQGALTMLFGTPSAPSFLVLSDWADDEFDPNFWTQDEADDAFWKQLEASNRAYFHEQIGNIEARRYDRVSRPRFAPDLWADWQAHLQALFDDYGDDPDAKAGKDTTWQEDALYLWTDYYPTLRTTAETYRQQCYHCHGASGGGDGSTARYLNPHPRDYRWGKFKFTALKDKSRPRHADLLRTLREGIYTTAMPSFSRFPDSMLSGLADYVRLLSIRGETEILVEGDYDPDAGLSLDSVTENYAFVVQRWRDAADKLIAYDGDVPRATPERIAHGKSLFLSETGANCAKCHGVTGRGDGVSSWEPGKIGIERVKDDWGNPIAPRDLTLGIYRFGRRPIDLYRRIYAGINGTPMPAHFGMQITDDGKKRDLDEDDVWDLVFYVRELPRLADRSAAHEVAVAAAEGGSNGHAAAGDGEAKN